MENNHTNIFTQNTITLKDLYKKLNLNSEIDSIDINPGFAFKLFLKNNKIKQKEIISLTGKHRQYISKIINNLTKKQGLIKTLKQFCDIVFADLSFIIVCENKIYKNNNITILLEEVRNELGIKKSSINTNHSASYYSTILKNSSDLGIRFKTLAEISDIIKIDFYYCITNKQER